jgi:hypothetical protein
MSTRTVNSRSLLVGLLCLATLPAKAHHSYAMFDMKQRTTLKGTVAKVEWGNPHVFIWVYAANKQGGQDLYGLENGSVSMLKRFGWSKNTLQLGEKVTVEFFALKDGRKGGYFINAKHADGRMTTGDPFAPGGTNPPPGAVKGTK